MVDLPEGAELADLAGRRPGAIARAAKEMLEPTGRVPGRCRRCGGSPTRSEPGPPRPEDWQWCARFLYQVIERRGTGGGNFRLMYSRFLDEVGREESGPAHEAADRWTALAGVARTASEPDAPRAGLWKAMAAEAERVLEVEERLWDSLS